MWDEDQLMFLKHVLLFCLSEVVLRAHCRVSAVLVPLLEWSCGCYFKCEVRKVISLVATAALQAIAECLVQWLEDYLRSVTYLCYQCHFQK